MANDAVAPAYPRGVFDPSEFESGTITLQVARRSPFWVEKSIIRCCLTESAPWVLTNLFSDGSILPVPLEYMAGKAQAEPTVSFSRKHKKSGRYIPFQAPLEALQAPELEKLSGDAALQRVARPRFDPEITPVLNQYVQAETAILLGKGLAKVSELQAISLAAIDMVGWGATRAPAARTVNLAGKAVNEAKIAAKLMEETGSIQAPFQQLLECARRVGMIRHLSLAQRVAVLEKICELLGYEYILVNQGTRVLLLAKNLSSGLEVTAWTVQLGKVQVQPTLDLVGVTAIRAFGG